MGCGGRATWRFTWTSGSPLRPPPLLQSSSSHFSSSQPSSSPSSSSPHRRRHRRHRRRRRLRRRRRRPRRRHLRLGFPGATRTTRQPELGPPGLCLGSLGLRQGGGPPPAAVASGRDGTKISCTLPSLLSPPSSLIPPLSTTRGGERSIFMIFLATIKIISIGEAMILRYYRH